MLRGPTAAGRHQDAAAAASTANGRRAAACSSVTSTEMRVPASFVLKRRADDGTTAVSAVSAQVEGRHVVIYDDMIRTGGSLIGAAQAYREAGATRISAIATHGIFPGDALEKIRASGLFDLVVCTDSHPRALQLRGDFLQVEPVARLFADFLRSTT